MPDEVTRQRFIRMATELAGKLSGLERIPRDIQYYGPLIHNDLRPFFEQIARLYPEKSDEVQALIREVDMAWSVINDEVLPPLEATVVTLDELCDKAAKLAHALRIDDPPPATPPTKKKGRKSAKKTPGTKPKKKQ